MLWTGHDSNKNVHGNTQYTCTQSGSDITIHHNTYYNYSTVVTTLQLEYIIPQGPPVHDPSQDTPNLKLRHLTLSPVKVSPSWWSCRSRQTGDLSTTAVLLAPQSSPDLTALTFSATCGKEQMCQRYCPGCHLQSFQKLGQLSGCNLVAFQQMLCFSPDLFHLLAMPGGSVPDELKARNSTAFG